MSESDLIRRWNEEQPQYRAWGSFVVSTMQGLIARHLQDDAVESFLRIPPKARLKESPSLVDKAFYRGKAYRNPYDDITDKVGARFVVLLNEDVRVVEELLVNCAEWDARKDKDYEEERSRSPLLFTYQSLHYIVAARHEVDIDGTRVETGTPCEVQIRTLLQHAHSELSHSRLYKPSSNATPEMVRASAKSMALIEAADDYFDLISAKARQNEIPLDEAKRLLATLYIDQIGEEPQFQKSSSIILDSLRSTLPEDLREGITLLLAAESYIVDKIKSRAAEAALYKQPVILLLYWLAKHKPASLKQLWPLDPNSIRPIYVDLGIAYDNDR